MDFVIWSRSSVGRSCRLGRAELVTGTAMLGCGVEEVERLKKRGVKMLEERLEIDGKSVKMDCKSDDSLYIYIYILSKCKNVISFNSALVR